MGCASSNNADHVEQRRNDEINEMMREAKLADMLHFKLLMLGAGESGKSTVVKQLTRIYLDDEALMEQQERFKLVLHTNTFQAIYLLVQACEFYNIKLDDDTLAAWSKVKDFKENDLITKAQAEAIYFIWKTPSIQEAYSLRHKFYFPDSGSYYFENVLRYADSYQPINIKDVVMTRVRSTGIIQNELNDPPIQWNVVDVGGQRSERKKWMRLFEGVKGILFVVNLSGYNSVLFEDEKVNRLQESINLFKKTVSIPMFKDTPIFVFLNKRDVFEEFLKTKNINTCFPDYTGPAEPEQCIEFIKGKFQEVMPHERPIAVAAALSANNRDSVGTAFKDLFDYVVANNQEVLEVLKSESNASKR